MIIEYFRCVEVVGPDEPDWGLLIMPECLEPNLIKKCTYAENLYFSQFALIEKSQRERWLLSTDD